MRELQMNVQSAVIIGAYQKAFRLDQQGTSDHSVGQIMNVVNVDSERIGTAVEYTQIFWGSIIQLVASIVLLTGWIGVSVWAGVGSMIFFIIAQAAIVPLVYTFTGSEMEIVDKRLGLLREMLQGIKIVKIRVLESYMISIIDNVRRKQLRFVKLENYMAIGLFSASQASAVLLPVFSFVLFGSLHGGLDASLVFAALSVFSLLIEPLNTLPQIVSFFVQAKVSWERTCLLFQAEEVYGQDTVVPRPPSEKAEPAIELTDATFRWPTNSTKDDDAEEEPGLISLILQRFSRSKSGSDHTRTPSEPALQSAQLRIDAGTFVAIVGQAGSGKSSLLAALNGQLIKVSGEIITRGRLAYVPQKSWLLSQTIESNILFGSEMDRPRFDAVLEVCALTQDLRELPNGVRSQVAEGAANLSGGQQARIALARALYSNADIYLLDDTFAALDPRVSGSVFAATRQFLHNKKTIVLVTHDAALATSADVTFIMQNGAPVDVGRDALDPILSPALAPQQSADEGGKKEAGVDPTEEAEEEEIAEIEARRKGHVSWLTYVRYINAAGGFIVFIVLLIVLLVQQSAVVVENLWLNWWTDRSFRLANNQYVLIYGLLGVAVSFLLVFGNMSVVMSTFRACVIYHKLSVEKVTHAPISFFEANPVGRIMNRFSKDMNAIDHELYVWVFNVVTGVFIVIGLIIIMCWPSPYLAILIPVLAIVYYGIYAFYRKANIDLKRLTSKNRSPLYSYVSESLEGMVVLKAFGCVPYAEKNVLNLLDFANRPFYISRSAELWLLLRIELLASFVTLAIVLIGGATSASGALVGLALSSSLGLTNEINALIRSTAEMESHMNSVERLDDYCFSLPSEGSESPTTPPKGWPSRGEIQIKELTVRYPSRPTVPALKSASLHIAAGERIGIIGRTGSGKSTLLSALLRLVQYEGSVIVDGIDISGLPLSAVRSGLVCVTQETTLFSGTLRSNMDPLASHTDAELLASLTAVGLDRFELGMDIEPGGRNVSQGHRQLVILATALLQRPKILILDEPTSSLDSAANDVVTTVLQQQFSGTTTLCIAHRLDTVMHFDRLVVLENGAIVQLGTPRELSAQQDAPFMRMVDTLGESERARILAMLE
ncbi:P-loop containing nucleoside triphosphate hydrolase protein [Mycena epipterygia]|nr:P-loop containing nucleoside triphosphate hydrolase protein [Mycena epipterygia]